jgi:hypothetical protein
MIWVEITAFVASPVVVVAAARASASSVGVSLLGEPVAVILFSSRFVLDLESSFGV